MATIHKYQNASGATLYRVQYRNPDRRPTSRRGFKTKRDAQAFIVTVEAAKLKGEYVAPANARITLGELGPAWLERQRGHMKLSSFRTIETAWRVRVQPRWGKVALGNIQPSLVQAWLAELSQGTQDTKPVGATVVIRTHQVLSGILRDAVRDNLIVRNPAADMKLPRKTRKPPVYLTHRQVADLAAAAGEHEALVLLLAYTGLRWGEAVGLRVADLDMLRRRATVSQNAVEICSQIHVGTTKGHKHRSVPLPAFLLPYLARQCESKAREDLLFCDDDGGYLRRPKTGSGWFETAVVAAGVPRTTPHDLRHTAASLAVSAGANVKAVQRMLGHASAAMTLDVYADLFDDDLEAVATALHDARLRENVATM